MLFVTFEGIDGSGKSTQAELLLERLRAAGFPAALFREPGGTELSERIRSLLLDPDLRIGALAELLLFSAARAQLLDERIRPVLEEGTIVICDRFYDSTTAYQGGGRGVAGFVWLNELNRQVTGGIVPDRTYLIAIDPILALERRTLRAEGGSAGRNETSLNSDQPKGEPEDTREMDTDRMEQSDYSFYDRVADAYDRLADEEPERILRLDGTKSIERLGEEIWTDMRRLLHHAEGTASTRQG